MSNTPLELDRVGPESSLLARNSSILNLDPPAHTRLRGLASQAFTARRIAHMESRLRSIVRGLIDALPESGEFELLESLSAPLPLIVIAEMLGAEPERYREFWRWSDVTVLASGALRAGDAETLRQLEPDLRAFRLFLEESIEERRARPREDLITALVQSTDQGQRLSTEDLVSFVRLLLIAGNETTTSLLGTGFISLLRNPGELEKLRANPSLLPSAIEEMLRYEAPVQASFRRVTQDLELGGRKLPAGSDLMLLLGSANRDPRKYEEPDRFDVTRAPSGHFSFGHGIHFCMGALLARLEARVAFEELLASRHLLGFARDQAERIEWHPNFIFRGPKRLRLAVTRADGSRH